MGANTKIEWAKHTFNPWIGCTKVHEGCAHCYAEALSKRTGKAQWGPSGTRVKTSEDNWRKPLKWNREAEAAGERARVFCASLADVFEDTDIPVTTGGKDADELRACNACGWIGFLPVILRQLAKRKNIYGCPQCDTDPDTRPATLADIRPWLFALIDSTPWLDWLLLTKRPENIRRMWPFKHDQSAAKALASRDVDAHPYYRSNVHLGTSISNQPTADKMVRELLKCRDLTPVLFLSAEPLLGPIDLIRCGAADQGESEFDWEPAVDQIIVGNESNGTRVGSLGDFPDEAAYHEAAQHILASCRCAGIAAFNKQMPIGGRTSHDMAEWPEWARVREFPQEAAHA